MSELDDQARGFLERARGVHAPSTDDAARVRGALMARVAADPGLLPASGRSGGRLGWGKPLVMFGAGTSLGFALGLYVAGAFTRDAPPVDVAVISAPTNTAVSAPAPVIVEPSSAPLVDDAVVEPSAAGSAGSGSATTPSDLRGSTQPQRKSNGVTPRATGVNRGRAALNGRDVQAPNGSDLKTRSGSDLKAPSGSDLKTELDGLRRAQELLHEGDAAWAIARLDELDHQGASSALLEERLATRAMAECVLGDTQRAALAALAARFPKSPHLARVHATCAAREHGTAQ
jgi:hypothetical protein